MRTITRKLRNAAAPAAAPASDVPASDVPASEAPVAAPAPAETAKPAAPSFLARVQRTADAMQYPFNVTSDRDDAYLRSYAYTAAKRNGTFGLADLLADATPVPGTSKRRNPFAGNIPSAPATDAGAIERAIKRGVLRRIANADGSVAYALTEAGDANDNARIGRERAASEAQA